ncbi:hypothetical protein AVL61_11645 [Kocuria rosea subsp. polaris]|uniref:Uncharacterized protein n=1 Tax=Kocuria rosea subsp. polaris TaxID=136273 RepID=A0A0W8I4R8_KOCRO|nr:hypothetical protein [Kocuria polaris]KUG52874.1 hypothetical protein AVL61_11645 [Kocuria polaris]
MPVRTSWARWLVVAGLAAMVLGALDPLEGSLVIVPGTGLAALGAFLGRSRRRVFSYWALLLVAIGVAALVGVSAVGGLGEGTGRSLWWAVLVVVPYAAGWLLGIIDGAQVKLPRPAH